MNDTPTITPQAVTSSDLKTEWELRADVEAEEKRAKLIWQEDALADLMRAGQKIEAEILAQNSVKKTDIVVRLRDFETVYPEEADDFVGALYFAAADEIERLRGLFRAEREDNLWNAYNIGHEKDGEWTHCFMSDGEWLIREIGLDPKVGHYDAGEVKRLIPLAAARIEGEVSK